MSFTHTGEIKIIQIDKFSHWKGLKHFIHFFDKYDHLCKVTVLTMLDRNSFPLFLLLPFVRDCVKQQWSLWWSRKEPSFDWFRTYCFVCMEFENLSLLFYLSLLMIKTLKCNVSAFVCSRFYKPRHKKGR